MLEVVREAMPLQTFKETIDSKGHKLLKEVADEVTTIGNDGLNMIERARRPPCGILLGTSSAGKTELLGSFLPKLREYAGSTAADTTPMLVRLQYPRELNPPNHGKVTILMPRDLYKLLSDLPKVKTAVHKDDQVADAWSRVDKVAREPEAKRDEEYDRKLYRALMEWTKEVVEWARLRGGPDDAEYFETLTEIARHFDPDGERFVHYNPVPRSMLIKFLDKGEKEKELTLALKEKEKLPEDKAREAAERYFMLRTVGAITELFVQEDILHDIDIYDTAGVRVGGDEADVLKPRQMVHSQMQAFKNRWGFERLVASVDIVIFILVLEEQQVDIEFQSLFDECRKYGNLQNRLFIFLNKIDKAADQAVKKGDIVRQGDEILPDDEKTWKLWVQTNVMDKIRGLGENFHNVFICRAPKFTFAQPESPSLIKNSKQSPTLKRYLFNADRNMDAILDNSDGGIKFGWLTVEKIMRQKGSQIRFNRLGQQILPYAKDVLHVLGAKRITEETPTDKDIDAYMEKLMEDLKHLHWRTEEFRLPERFGEICIYKKLATSRQIEEALADQEKIEKETGRRVRIGQILVDKKYMTLEQVREVLQASETEHEDWDSYQKDTFKHVRERVYTQIVCFMEEKGRPIVKGNIPVEAVIDYLTEPVKILESELKGLYTDKEKKIFQEGVQNVMECQLTAALWNQDRMRKYLWSQKPKITSSFHIRDDISEEEARVVSACYQKLQALYEKLPPLEKEA